MQEERFGGKLTFPIDVKRSIIFQPRNVQDHNSLGLALTWNRAIQAYLLYRPPTLPMYDASSRNCTITADTETLFRRMVALIPEEQNPGIFWLFVVQYFFLTEFGF